jgi:aspartyl protease family protein
MRIWSVFAALILLTFLLAWQFPYAVGDTAQNMQILYLILLIALIASGSGMARRMTSVQALRDGCIWLGLILTVALLYSFRADIQGTRLYGALVPSAVRISADGALTVSRAADGHFHMEGEINGSRESFLVDTGASDIVLSQRAATAAGLNPETLNYSRSYQTANGTVSGAPVHLDSLRVGTVMLRDIPASVNKGKMDESLLGMEFLNRFKSYHVEDNQLTLYP